MVVALITGCSSGFGLEAAIAFAQNGDTPVATMRNLAKATELEKRAADAGVEVAVERLDVNDPASVDACVAKVLADHGRIDSLVNNAGIGGGGPIESVPMETFEAVMDTNFWGPVRMIRAVLPHLREQRSGSIINVGSLAGRIPGTLYNGPYIASKHAIGALSETLAMEVEPFGIGVVCIEPGFFATEIGNNSEGRSQGTDGTPYQADAEWWDAFMSGSVESGADPAEVGRAIVAAAHDPSPLHQPMGDDAAAYLALLEASSSFEDWIAQAMPIVEGTAGPRPDPT